MSATLELTQALISCRSVTPVDGGCQELIADRLKAIGFHTESVVSGPESFQVTNLWAIKKGKSGDQGKVLLFAGHTDVVPTGPLENGPAILSSQAFVMATYMVVVPLI